MDNIKRYTRAREARWVGLCFVLTFLVVTIAINGWLAGMEAAFVGFGVLSWCIGTEELEHCTPPETPTEAGFDLLQEHLSGLK